MTGSHGEVTRESRPSVRFLLDWREDHRQLSDVHRDAVGRYITAIVERDPRAQEDVRLERDLAADLWLKFRDLYDGLAVSSARSENEVFARAMSRL